MARKKRSHLTHKKKSASKNPNKAPPEGLPRTQFAALKPYGSFVVEDAEGEHTTFRKDDTAYIKPYETDPSEETPPEDYWIARIREIRGTDDSSDPEDAQVWVRVQWYWSPQEVAQVVKSFKPEYCGKYEKIFSDSYDIVSSRCFSAPVQMKRYGEREFEQPFIEEDVWFCRYDFEYNMRRITPKQATVACVCGVPYIPGVDEILHFCPRPGCRSAHHQTCLLERGLVEDLSVERCRRLVATWLDAGSTDTVASLAYIDAPPRKRRKGMVTSPTVFHDDPLEDFPRELIAIAEQEIVRGTKAGGIVGNVAAVTAARNIIYKALSGDGTIPNDWETIDMIDSPFPIAAHQTTRQGFLCPSCGSPI
ncbi:hypothetical protein PAXRUDRAFT_24417 [Paxillus rubicundulus Ve08.2h10]|uniref:BAH domain-containing protein n=1 Tax=Paxillus rubicundulus Ve08.2h10 TaxID=930991 RepID=A0A0D0DUH4_9AGAM|nr:hypothetical protein PAXRUDRAFT_24417 [Paxillus rubicundulus Ve08.2h10]